MPALNAWLVWDGNRWTSDERLEHRELAKATMQAFCTAYGGQPTARRIHAMLELAKSDPAIVRVAAELDRDAWLLCTPIGTIDLRTGNVRANRRGDDITRCTEVPFAADAAAPLWDRVLARSLPDPDVRGYLQRLAGVSAIGLVREHVLPILWCNGANGKSTILETLIWALGDSARAAPLDLLMHGRRGAGSPTPELADLRGRRLVLVSETSEDGRLAVERVKAITGGDTITARPLHGHPIAFRPSHTIWLMTNHRPRVTDDGEAIWRRLALLPFDVTIPEVERDPELAEKLRREGPGILRWIVDGCLAYQRDGLEPPAAVKAATRDYRDGEDVFGAFLAEQTTTTAGTFTTSADLHRAYTAWAVTQRSEVLTQAALADKLRRRDFVSAKGTKGVRGWRGIELNRVAEVALEAPDSEPPHTRARTGGVPKTGLLPPPPPPIGADRDYASRGRAGIESGVDFVESPASARGRPQ